MKFEFLVLTKKEKVKDFYVKSILWLYHMHLSTVSYWGYNKIFNTY